MIHVEGEQLLDGSGRPIQLRGIAFGNRVWNDDRIPTTHHDERDYARLAGLGMNVVRFYLNYHTFESDAAPGQWLADGFGWLDQNVAWAQKHGIYLILNLHVPPGGYQSMGAGKALWSDPTMQRRFVALWRAIAERYRDNATIAGYDLLNEPVVDKSISQWKELAERAIAAIREVDRDHSIFVERVNSVGNDWKEDADRNFFKVDDPNVVYEFHFYKPFHFTHQSAPWAELAAESARYPDANAAEVEWFFMNYETGTFNSPKLPAGDTEWKYYEGQSFKVSDPKFVIGKPSLACSRVGDGRALFDDIVLEQLADNGAVERQLWRVNLDTARGWYFWKKSGGGTLSVASGHDGSALSVTGTSDDANLGGDPWRFRPQLGKTYRLNGWMKGERIPATAQCQIRLDFSSSSVPVQNRDRAFLAQELEAYLTWGKRHHVPLFLGEFGAIRFAFDDDRGGLRWVSDMLDLALASKLHFTYHDYHETHFGLYFGDQSLPDENNANQPLIQLFRQKLGAPAPSPTH